MAEYNTTQLNPETSFKRHVYHRDQFAHFLRWTHVLKFAKIGGRILDFGSGSGSMAEVLYCNRYKQEQYLGLDIRMQTIKKANEKYTNVPWVNFCYCDLVKDDMIFGNDWDIITSFEVLEHVGKANAGHFLDNIKKCMNKDTVLYLSTPNYDEKVGAATNHIIDGVVGEFEYYELNELLDNKFEIIKQYGTFASQKDYKHSLNEWQQKTFEALHKYYDSNLVSNIMAPLVQAKYARNILWVLKCKKD